MALITEMRVRARAAKISKSAQKAAPVILREAAVVADSDTFDISLSHSILDADLMLGVVRAGLG